MLLINIDVLCKDVVKNSTAVSMFLSFRASLTIDCNLQTDFRVLRLGGWGGGSLFCHSELILFELLARGKIGAWPDSVSSA